MIEFEILAPWLARGVALNWFIAFWSLDSQILGLAGQRGITPIGETLRKARRDFGLVKGVFYFPTVLWLSSTDRALQALPRLGMLVSVLAFVGGPLSPLWFVLAFVLYLSLDRAVDLLYPWDCLLFEAGLLAVFVSVPSLRDLAFGSESVAQVSTSPWINLACRVLLMRVMLGFGKFKFFSKGPLDPYYLRSFLIGQPVPSRLGLWAFYWPKFLFPIGLALMFVVECVAPFGLLIGGPFSIAASVLITGLMTVIWLCGNFGFFNPLVMVLCAVGLSDPPSLDMLTQSFGDVPSLVAAFSIMAGVMLFPFNSWVTRAWAFWPDIARHRFAVIRWISAAFRMIGTFRLAHAYGVFGKEGGPAAKFIPRLEGSVDGVTYTPFRYRYMVSSERDRPKTFAPHCPRLDHYLLYEGYGISVSNMLASVFHTGDPYAFGEDSMLHRIAGRLLEGSPRVMSLFEAGPFSTEPPKFVRAVLIKLEPSVSEKGDGSFWTEEVIHTQLATRTRRHRQESLADIDFHPDHLPVWFQRMSASRRWDWAATNRGGASQIMAMKLALKLGSDAPYLFRWLDALSGASTPTSRLQVLSDRWPVMMDLHDKKAALRRAFLRQTADNPPNFAPGFLVLMTFMEQQQSCAQITGRTLRRSSDSQYILGTGIKW